MSLLVGLYWGCDTGVDNFSVGLLSLFPSKQKKKVSAVVNILLNKTGTLCVVESCCG